MANAFCVPFKKPFLSFELMVTRLWGLGAMFSGRSALGPGTPCSTVGWADSFATEDLAWWGRERPLLGCFSCGLQFSKNSFPEDCFLTIVECGRSFSELAEQCVTGQGGAGLS